MPTFPNDPYGGDQKSKTNPSASQVRDFHLADDVDADVKSHHHTLGQSRNQASPGNHVHDGKLGNKVGQGMGLYINGAKGGNAALGSLIAMLQYVIDFQDNTTP